MVMALTHYLQKDNLVLLKKNDDVTHQNSHTMVQL